MTNYDELFACRTEEITMALLPKPGASGYTDVACEIVALKSSLAVAKKQVDILIDKLRCSKLDEIKTTLLKVSIDIQKQELDIQHQNLPEYLKQLQDIL